MVKFVWESSQGRNRLIIFRFSALKSCINEEWLKKNFVEFRDHLIKSIEGLKS
jgi:hypothetical protein